MKTLIATLALALLVATSASAKTEKVRPLHVEPHNSVTCGHVVVTDPDRRIRSALVRDCSLANSPGN
jgi:hypothetical protein